MSPRVCLAACIAISLPASVGAQQVNGLAEWTVGQAGSTYDGQSYENNAFSQLYVLGLDTPIIDGRLMKISTEGTIRTNALTIGTTQAARKGDQRDTSYRLGASLFPLRPFPFTVQTSRAFIDESGDYPSTNTIRGGFGLVGGAVPSAFRTLNRTTTASWQLNTAALPRVQVNYASGRSETTGSAYRGAQEQRNLHVGLTKETTRLRQAIRYDRSAIDNLVLAAYNQENRDLAYEFGALLTKRTRVRLHTGRRRTVSQFDLPSAVVDPAAGAYALPTGGDTTTQYVITGVTFDAASRFSIDATGSADWQRADPVESGATLLVSSAHLDVGGGLALSASGTYGNRQQVVGESAIDVTTKSGQTGATFRTGPRWLEGSLSYTRGMGSNRTPDGSVGETSAWTGQAIVSSSVGWFTVSAGRERSRSRDDILDFGNIDVQRDRASIQANPGRLSLQTNWEDSVVERGRENTFAWVWQRIGSASASFPITRNATVTANAGTFTNVGFLGTDTTVYWGGVVQAELARGFQLSAWVRHDDAKATQVSLDQQGLVWLATLEYRLRDFTFAGEYRNTFQDISSTLQNTRFQGRQFLIRVSRRVRVPL